MNILSWLWWWLSVSVGLFVWHEYSSVQTTLCCGKVSWRKISILTGRDLQEKAAQGSAAVLRDCLRAEKKSIKRQQTFFSSVAVFWVDKRTFSLYSHLQPPCTSRAHLSGSRYVTEGEGGPDTGTWSSYLIGISDTRWCKHSRGKGWWIIVRES